MSRVYELLVNNNYNICIFMHRVSLCRADSPVCVLRAVFACCVVDLHH